MHNLTPSLHRIALGFLALGYLSIPLFELRIILMGAFFCLASQLFTNGATIGKSPQLFFLALLYTASYLLMPYWAMKPGATHVIISFLVLTGGYILFMVGCYTSVSDIKLPPVKDRIGIHIGAIFFAAVVLNYLPMTSSIAYRGDSDYHIKITISLFQYFTNNMHYLYIFLLLLIITIWCAFKKRQYYIVLIPLCAIGLCILWYFFQMASFPHWIRRYPLLFYLFNLGFTIPISSVFAIDHLLDESNYHLFILACTTLISVFAVTRIHSSNLILKLSIGLYIITIPIMHYYSSLVYIDMAMALFAFIAICNFEKSVDGYCKNGTIDLTFIFIILISYLKETALVALIIFCFFAGYIIYRHSNPAAENKILLWVKFAVITFSPLFVFLFFRHVPHNTYQLEMSNLFVLGNYNILLVSLWEQLGLLLPASILSIAYLIVRKKYFTVIFNLCLICGYVLFFMLNGEIRNAYLDGNLHYTGTIYLGYSRFNLVLIPSFLTLLIAALNLVKPRFGKIAVFIFVMFTISNQFMSPINFTNGLRKAGWGDYTIWTSEYDYPYNDVYDWISRHPEVTSLGVIGRTYPYFDQFYHWKNKLRFDQVEGVWVKNKNKSDVTISEFVLYHQEPAFLSPPDPQTVEILADYRVLKTFGKGDLALTLYKKNTD